MATKVSLELECDNLIEGIDKSAAKIENFSKKAEQSINAVEKNIGNMSETQKRAYDAVKKSYDGHQKAINEISKRYEELRERQKNNIELTKSEKAELQALSGQYKKHSGAVISLTKDFEMFKKQTDGLVGSVKSLGKNSLSDFFGGIARGVGVGAAKTAFEGLKDLVGNIASLGIATQQISSQFAAMTGSLQQGANAYKEFNEVYRNTNYDQTAVMGMGKQLMNMGYSARNAADLIMLCADAAAGLGQGADGAQHLVDIISKIQSTGRMSTKDIESLVESGLDMGQVFANMGVTAAEALNGLKNGTLDNQTAIEALTKYLHTFDGKMAESKQNLKDIFGDITGNLQEIAARVGDAIASLIVDSGISQELTNLTEGLLQGFTALCDAAKQLGKLLMPIFGEPVRVAIAGITNAIYLVGDVLKALVVGAHDVKEAFGTMCDWVWGKIKTLVEPLSWIYDKVAGIVGWVGENVQEAVDRVQDIHNQIGTRFGEIVGTNPDQQEDGNNFRASLSAMVADESAAAENLTAAYNNVANAQMTMLNNGAQLAAQSKTTINWAGELTNAFGKMGSDILKNGINFMDGLKNAFRRFAESVINQLMNIALKAMMVNALTGLFGGGGSIISGEQFGLGKVPKFGFADGGFVSGEGTSTSDSIPAMLSNGEYVLNAAAVRNVGRPQLDSINAGARHYASGGYVGGAEGTFGGRTVTFNVSAMDASGFADYLAKGGMDVIKQALFEEERSFGSAVGVW